MCISPFVFTNSRTPPNSKQKQSGPARSVLCKVFTLASCNGLRTESV